MKFYRSKKTEAGATFCENEIEIQPNSNAKNSWYQTFSLKIKEKFLKSDVNNKGNFTNSYESMCFDNYAYGDCKSYGF